MIGTFFRQSDEKRVLAPKACRTDSPEKLLSDDQLITNEVECVNVVDVVPALLRIQFLMFHVCFV